MLFVQSQLQAKEFTLSGMRTQKPPPPPLRALSCMCADMLLLLPSGLWSHGSCSDSEVGFEMDCWTVWFLHGCVHTID